MQATRARRLFFRLIAVVVVLQVLQFFVVDHRYSPRNWAIYRYSSDDVIEIALREDPNPQSRYSVYVALAEIAPHSRILMPVEGSTADTHRAYGFGRASEVIVIPDTSGHYPEDGPMPGYIAAEGPGAHRGPPWRILLDPAHEPGGNIDDPAAFLPDALRDGNRGSNPGPPREFLWLNWQKEPVGDPAEGHYDYYRLVIETSLLTPEQRELYGVDTLELPLVLTGSNPAGGAAPNEGDAQ